MSLRCSRLVGIRVLPPADMPLDTAIYVSSANAIFGTRGGFIHKFNASTGALISKRRYSPVPGAHSGLAYCTVDSTLWCSSSDDLSRSSSVAAPATQFNYGNAIYRISTADALTTVATHSTIFTGMGLDTFRSEDGCYFLTESNATGTNLMYALFDYRTAPAGNYMIKINPATHTVVSNQRISSGYICPDLSELITVGNRLWYVINGFDEVMEYDPSLGTGLWYTGNHYTLANANSNRGCYISTNGYLYWGHRNGYVFQVKVNPLTPGSLLAIAVAGTTDTVYACRYDSVNGRLVTANGPGDSVSWFTPGGTKYYKTGFDFPVDIVIAGTHTFAVQAGSVPLKEIDFTTPTGTIP